MERVEEGWKRSKKNQDIFIKKDSTLIYVKSIVQVECSFDEMFRMMSDISLFKQMNPRIKDIRTVKEFNENLNILYVSMRVPIATDRDMVFLNYKEILQEEGLGIFCRVTIDIPEFPPTKDHIRQATRVGSILRRVTNDTCTFSYCVLGERSKNMPFVIIKNIMLHQCKQVLKWKEYAEKVVKTRRKSI